MKDKLIDFINKVTDPPTIPVVAMKVLEVCSSAECSIQMVERIISDDPALSARVLKIANSAFFGTLRSIKTVKSAIVLIGINVVKNLVIAASIKDIHKKSGLAEHILWEHSIGAAVAAHTIAMEYNLDKDVREAAFVGGLLHDIGKVLLNHSIPDRFSFIMQEAYNQEEPCWKLEEDELGFTHAEVGGMVVKKWNLSPELEKAIEYHHKIGDLPEVKDSEVILAMVLEFADMVCHYLGIGVRASNQKIDFLNTLSCQRLGIDIVKAASLLDRIKTAYEQEKEVFK